MTIGRIDALLNDAEINYLCDLFLSNLGFDRTSPDYRHFRNAVILASHGILKPAEMFTCLAECAAIARDDYMKKLDSALDKLPVPIYDAYNAVYMTFDDRRYPVMRKTDVNGTVVFLGTVFMYIVVSYYPKYGRVILRNDANR